MKNIKEIKKAIEAAQNAKEKLDSKYNKVLHLVLENFEFTTVPSEYSSVEDYFSIDYQPSDGIVLADDHSRVYHLGLLLTYIETVGPITDYDDLKQFSI